MEIAALNFIEYISQPWHWAFSGFMITVVMFILTYLGKKFGLSGSFTTLCSIGGAGKWYNYFDFDWRKQDWLLVLVIGAIMGGSIGSSFLSSSFPVQISAETISDLSDLGISYPTSIVEGAGFLPTDIFNFENLITIRGFTLIILGGFFIGFGTRWAGGCTSGHAISGLSSLQIPSLIAVIGFFVGGLITTHFLFPLIFNSI